jgi:hypothetical protein
MRPLYRAPIAWDTLFTLILVAGSPVFAVWATGWGLDLYRTYGLAPGDGGVLRPYPQRLAFCVVVLLLAWGLVLVGLGVGRRYVLSLDVDAAGENIRLRVLTWVVPTPIRVPAASILGARTLNQKVHSTPSSWYLLRVEGHRLPFMMNRGWARIDDDESLRAVLRHDGSS